MTRFAHRLRILMPLTGILLTLLCDGMRFLLLYLRPSLALAAEHLFLRQQLALYQERHVKPRRATNMIRLAFIYLARWFDWRQALAVVQPATLIRWHRQGFRPFWRWKSTPGRPPIPAELQALSRRLTCDDPSWGEERIANELWLKLGLRVSPRTVRTYLARRPERGGSPRASWQRWRTFVRNHAKAMVACDFCTVVTATLRLLSVFVEMEHATRRILHVNVTAHPTARWTLQQLRVAIPSTQDYGFLIHDRDAIFSQELEQRIRHLGLRILQTPPRSPQANALCERLLGALRRECVDFVIPLTAHHLRRLLKGWVHHYNEGRPHMSLGLGIPPWPASLPVHRQVHRHRLPAHLRVVSRPILGGLHHEYRLEARAA
jgi:putative transposase